MSDLLTAVDGQVRNYEQLRAVGPFDVLPFLLAVPGLILIAAGCGASGVPATAKRRPVQGFSLCWRLRC